MGLLHFRFHFAQRSKSLAIKDIPSSCSYITTDDAISSFIWQSVTRARLPRLDPSASVLYTRALDVQPYLNIPGTYPGCITKAAYNHEIVQDLVDKPLGVIASQLRTAVDPKTASKAHDTRALATTLARVPDKKTIYFLATVDLSRDLMISSWSKGDCYGLDFNLGLRKP